MSPDTSTSLNGDDVIKNAVYRQQRTFYESFSKGKSMTLQVNCWKNKRAETRVSLIKSLLEKLINSVQFGSGRRRTWPYRHCSVQWHRAVAISAWVKDSVTHCKHWFWVKLVLITFISAFTTAVDYSIINALTDLCFFVEFCPFVVV